MTIDDEMLAAAAVKQMTGARNDMTLWRWLRDPRLAFPAPSMMVLGRRYWRRSVIEEWLARMAAQPTLPRRTGAVTYPAASPAN